MKLGHDHIWHNRFDKWVTHTNVLATPVTQQWLWLLLLLQDSQVYSDHLRSVMLYSLFCPKLYCILIDLNSLIQYYFPLILCDCFWWTSIWSYIKNVSSCTWLDLLFCERGVMCLCLYIRYYLLIFLPQVWQPFITIYTSKHFQILALCV